MLDTLPILDNPISITQQNEHVLTGTVHKLSSLIDGSINDGAGEKHRRQFLSLVGLDIHLVRYLSSIAQRNIPITEEIVRSYIETKVNKPLTDKVDATLYPSIPIEEPLTAELTPSDSGLGKVILKAKSLLIGIPFQPDCFKNYEKYINLAGRIYDFTRCAQDSIDNGTTVDNIKIPLGAYYAKKPAALGAFLKEVFGEYKPIRQEHNGQVRLVAPTLYPDLYLVHTLEQTDVATEQSHSFYLAGSKQMPKGYILQPEIIR
jgi:hypothetical protein